MWCPGFCCSTFPGFSFKVQICSVHPAVLLQHRPGRGSVLLRRVKAVACVSISGNIAVVKTSDQCFQIQCCESRLLVCLFVCLFALLTQIMCVYSMTLLKEYSIVCLFVYVSSIICRVFVWVSSHRSTFPQVSLQKLYEEIYTKRTDNRRLRADVKYRHYTFKTRD